MARLPEQKLRDYVEPRMRDHWMMTWHEDRQVSPGVPDAHYVMSPRHRVGWLEFKALDADITPRNRVTVMPSQHQYLRRWCPYMPIHFLIRIVDRIYIVPGERHMEVTQMTCYADIAMLSELQFDQKQIAEALPPFLKQVTAI